ncbi:diacylglycerol/lipid kinase family protein [Polluticoccus soli]|uniref:diacylglycerol/lipid kinase family protein n=1 Tax=Polluticoccus soli TaxID=3034150 RepID=UPI0023E190A1|nr:diacylglycerol kinase family protein [Flavipsychrobacter sp. JY13-12]
MSKQHLVFVINQKSGVDRRKSVQQAIDKRLDLNRFSYEIVHTEYPKHGTFIAREAAAKKAYAVVAVGGDGSVNDITAGLWGSDTALAIVPKGSGNGMARTLGIPRNTEQAIDIINKGNLTKIDIGFANGVPFISNAGVAFDVLISNEFAKSTRRGFAIYSWLVTKHLWMYKENDWTIKIDGNEVKEKAFIISVANGKQFGYNFQIAPEASWTDGLFDIIVIRKFPKMLGGQLVIKAMNGSLTQSKYVQHYRGKEVVISHPLLNMMQLDGDARPCEHTVRFHLEQCAQKVVVP